MLANLRAQSAAAWERPGAKKLRRITYHVVRATKKFIFGTGNAAWVMGTSMLVLVMPLVFEIDREQSLLEWDGAAGATPQVILPKV